MRIENIVIDDSAYFFALENELRDTEEGFPAYESKILLPVAEKVLEESGISEDELTAYPTEGYYYKSVELQRYFKIIRNLQINTDIIKRVNVGTDSFAILKRAVSDPVFGPEKVTEVPGKILAQRGDILSFCLEGLYAGNMSPKPYSLEKIWEALGKYKYDYPNLIGLAYLTGNIACVASASETNIANQEAAVFVSYSGYCGLSGYSGYSGSGVSGYGGSAGFSQARSRKHESVYRRIIWQVSPAVEKMGAALIEEYNKLMAQYLPREYEGNRVLGSLVVPEPTFIYGMPRRIEQPKVMRLRVGKDGQNYNWLILNSVKDFYSYKVIMTSAVTYDNGLKWAIMNDAYEDKPEDCNTPGFEGINKPSTPFINKT